MLLAGTVTAGADDFLDFSGHSPEGVHFLDQAAFQADFTAQFGDVPEGSLYDFIVAYLGAQGFNFPCDASRRA